MAGAGRTSVVAAAALHELAPAGSLLAIAEALHGRYGSWWLDSALAGGRLGRFSFAGAEPYAVARASARGLEIETRRAARPDLPPGRTLRPGDPLGRLEELLAMPLRADPAPELPLRGGAVGWLGYELAARGEPRLPAPPPDEHALPDLCFLLVDRVVALDHASGRRFACALGFAPDEREARSRAARAAAAWGAELAELERMPRPAPAERERMPPPAPAERGRMPPPSPPAPGPAPRAAPRAGSVSLDAPAHAKAVSFLLERIEAGDVYQACLTHRFERPFAGDAWRLYRALRARSPAPFAAWLSLPEAAICSSSPERFLRVDAAGTVESRPIKGTRPRGADPMRDAALARELAASAKDRAENLMIVDLVRHDLGRVCEIGSVAVPELRAIESYAHVHHMVSTVTGTLRAGAGRADAIRAAFPPGSMTGAPKLAAMSLLAGLEPVRRGVYSGALGYLDVAGGADLSVVIRTAVVRGGRAYVHSGGGIVADSEPASEWRESLAKARALLEAIGAAEGDSACP